MNGVTTNDLQFPEPVAVQSAITVGFKRPDGTLVGLLKGLPYNFTSDEPYWDEALALSINAPLQEPVLVNGLIVGFLPEYINGTLITTPVELPVTIGPAQSAQVSARQFKLQLYISGLYTNVEAWVAGQSLPVKIAYDNSSTFYRDDATLEAGFTALGFTGEQVDAFFEAAKLL